MHIVIAGATGLIGQRLVANWLKQNHSIAVISRKEEHIRQVFADRVQAITWDALTAADLQKADLVVNLAGAGLAAKLWTKARKEEILSSRIETTKKIATLLTQIENPPPLFNASAASIYGLQKEIPDDMPIPFTENSPIDWQNEHDFLAEVARKWEQAAQAAVEKGVRVVFTRFAIVLAKEGGALPKMALPFQLFMGGPLGTGYQPFSWVTIEDVVRAFDFLIAKADVSGPVNVVAPECVTQKQFAHTIGKILHRPSTPLIPAFLLKIALGQMAKETLFEGLYVYPQRLLELGFRFQYPTIESALTHIYREKKQ